MKLEIGQKLKDAELFDAPVGSIVTNMYGEMWLKTTGSGVWKRASYVVRERKNVKYGFILEYLPPQPIQVGDEISREKVNELPVGTIFSYVFNQEWDVLVITDGFFIANNN